jgi:hypothetical protein
MSESFDDDVPTNPLEQVIAFKGEFMLAGWNESHQGGRKVSFFLPDEGEEHPFKKFTIAKGKRAGHRFMAVLVEIADDETPVPQEPEKPKGGVLSKNAARMCNVPLFQGFLREVHHNYWSQCSLTTEYGRESDIAAEVLRRILGVQSRSEIDHNQDAATKWHALMREYSRWTDAS